MTIYETPAFALILGYYGSRVAQRSQVPLINHIREGITILERLEASLEVQEAYAVHPLFQADDDLRVNAHLLTTLRPMVAGLTVEYRSVANDFLSNQIETGPDAWGASHVYAKKPLRLSPLPGVNLMLVADKVQNRKDFLAHHLATHDRSKELDFYFNLWLKRLDISETKYRELVRDL